MSGSSVIRDHLYPGVATPYVLSPATLGDCQRQRVRFWGGREVNADIGGSVPKTTKSSAICACSWRLSRLSEHFRIADMSGGTTTQPDGSTVQGRAALPARHASPRRRCCACIILNRSHTS